MSETDPRIAPMVERLLIVHPSWYKRLSGVRNRGTDEARYAATTLAESMLRVLDEHSAVSP
jgi:hypothetical protein